MTMFTSEDPRTLAADLSRMTLDPVTVERAEALLAESMAWLPQSEPMQCIAEDRMLTIAGTGDVRSLHRRTILFRRAGDRLQIIVEVALLGPDGIEHERRRFDTPTGELERYVNEVRARLSGSA